MLFFALIILLVAIYVLNKSLDFFKLDNVIVNFCYLLFSENTGLCHEC